MDHVPTNEKLRGADFFRNEIFPWGGVGQLLASRSHVLAAQSRRRDEQLESCAAPPFILYTCTAQMLGDMHLLINDKYKYYTHFTHTIIGKNINKGKQAKAVLLHSFPTIY